MNHMINTAHTNNSSNKCTTIASAALDSPTPAPRMSIMLGELLGKGQFGQVFKAVTADGELRAVKVIPIASLRSKKHVENFDREIRILTGADHPNLVRLFTAKRRGNDFWIVLDYCGGGDLQSFIRSRPRQRLTETVALHFFRQLGVGLAFMAEKGLIHRDLKPAK